MKNALPSITVLVVAIFNPRKRGLDDAEAEEQAPQRPRIGARRVRRPTFPWTPFFLHTPRVNADEALRIAHAVAEAYGLRFSRHATERMQGRTATRDDVREAIRTADTP
jgi:hypothetical protein